MKATRASSINKSFALRPEVLKRIAEIVRGTGSRAELEVECAGDISLKPDSIDELLSLPNVGPYKIKVLEIASRGAPATSVKFSVVNGSTPIWIYINGNNEDVFRVSDALNKEIIQVYQGRWPEFLDHLLFGRFYVFTAALLGNCAGLAGIIAFADARHVSSFFSRYGFLTCLLASAVLAFAFWAFFAKVYPKGLFLIGAGVEEYDSMKFRRQQLSIWTLLAALIAAVAIAIVGHWIHL